MKRFHLQARWLAAAVFGLGAVGRADVLPEDRTDLLYHRYDGGGLVVQGPSVLVRKKFGDSFSMSYQYYEDLISSASIDVLSQASAYKEKRTQNNLGFDYLHGNTLYSVGFINSNEPDYKSNTAFVSISQSMFGDLTTVSMGFTRGWDKVGEVDKGVFQKYVGTADHRNWSVGLSQVLTRNLLLGLNFEADESDGYLQNPYRGVRFIDPEVARGYTFGPAVSPNTRTGDAASAQLKYYLPWHAALDGNYRLYSDTWGILANTVKIGYTQSLFTDWTFEANARYYWQGHAQFLQRPVSVREFAEFHVARPRTGAVPQPDPRHGRQLGVPSALAALGGKGDAESQPGSHAHRLQDFRNNLIASPIPGDEPLYTLDANVMQFFISFWY